MNDVRCPGCVKVIVDLGFEVEGRMTQSTQSKDCPRCGTRWTITREDDPKIPTAPRPADDSR